MANASKPRSRRRWYRTLQAVHLWVGLILCLPLVVLGEGLGPVWKWAVFLSGGLPPLFAVTGRLMWWLNRKAAGSRAPNVLLHWPRRNERRGGDACGRCLHCATSG